MDNSEIIIKGLRQNNLKNISLRIPKNKIVVFTGVSGSGKSSLINEILYKALAKKLNRARTIPGDHDGIDGVEQLDKIVFLEDGRILAVGTHETLYASCAPYRHMVELQQLEEEGGEDFRA